MSFSIIFPGQGSQAIGMMSELAQEHSLVKELFVEASDLLGVDLWQMTQEGPIEDLSQTENTQPALLVAGVAAWRVWQVLGGQTPKIMAGHSLGEYTALVAAGSLSFADGVELVRDRGRYMQEAVPAGGSGMAAVIGLNDEKVIAVCEDVTAQLPNNGLLQAVNFNAPGQVVVAGSADAIKLAVDAMKEAGAKRTLPLPVSIPAHSSLMSPASERLAQRLENVDISLPAISVMHNCNLEIASTAEQIKANLVTQLDSPVRWVESIQAIHELGVNQFIESGPGRALCGMVKRIIKGADIACIEKPSAFSDLI